MPFIYENARRAGKTHPGRIETVEEYLARMTEEGKMPGAHLKEYHIPKNTLGRRAYNRKNRKKAGK